MIGPVRLSADKLAEIETAALRRGLTRSGLVASAALSAARWLGAPYQHRLSSGGEPLHYEDIVAWGWPVTTSSGLLDEVRVGRGAEDRGRRPLPAAVVLEILA